MPALTRRRRRTLVLLALGVAVLVAIASLLHFRAGPRAPEGADVVVGGQAGEPWGDWLTVG